MATTHYHTPHGLHIADRVHALVEGLQQRLRQRAELRETYYVLNRLSERELADLNISRSDIATIARSHVYGA